MADEKEPKAEAKAAKKVKKTAVPEVPEPEQAFPTATEIRSAKKAELTTWSERYGLSQEGTVDDLRKRLRAFIEKEEAKKAAPEEAKPAPPKRKRSPKRNRRRRRSLRRRRRGRARRQRRRPKKRSTSLGRSPNSNRT